jgi:hypothetical protein
LDHDTLLAEPTDNSLGLIQTGASSFPDDFKICPDVPAVLGAYILGMLLEDVDHTS